MCFLDSVISQKLLSRLQVLIVLVVIVVEIFSVDSFKQTKNVCDDSGQFVIAEYDWTFRCAENKQLACGKPQRRAILLRTLLELNITTPTTPNMIIIYRCENSGCCVRAHEECTNTSSTKHRINFTTSSGLRRETTIYNHTACSCQYIRATQECFL
ncbi:uncharacterized protein LOC114339514 [Diabrotica virgifera virgifera]|uniref:Uncharacterized protein LOC114339514 n=1 Tax=Diabrotica virgifera virgifera TaxID=50390 RepID=A0A6P7GL74_DIAVI|nr:uncharacterized protein LOC114339514 [Diabrotica virgifera virgifera]